MTVILCLSRRSGRNDVAIFLAELGFRVVENIISDAHVHDLRIPPHLAFGRFDRNDDLLTELECLFDY